MIHLKTGMDGLLIGVHLTAGKVSGCTQLECSLDIGPDSAPRAGVTDNGYASKGDRAALRERRTIAVMPHTSDEKQKPAFFPKALMKAAPASNRAWAS